MAYQENFGISIVTVVLKEVITFRDSQAFAKQAFSSNNCTTAASFGFEVDTEWLMIEVILVV